MKDGSGMGNLWGVWRRLGGEWQLHAMVQFESSIDLLNDLFKDPTLSPDECFMASDTEIYTLDSGIMVKYLKYLGP